MRMVESAGIYIGKLVHVLGGPPTDLSCAKDTYRVAQMLIGRIVHDSSDLVCILFRECSMTRACENAGSPPPVAN